MSLQRSAAEKHRDEQELMAARNRERGKKSAKPPAGRHSRFGGTYIVHYIFTCISNLQMVRVHSLNEMEMYAISWHLSK